jgi:hypothetical protein
MGKVDTESVTRKKRIICLPFSQEDYILNVDDPDEGRG